MNPNRVIRFNDTLQVSDGPSLCTLNCEVEGVGHIYNNADMITIKPAKKTKTKTHLLIKTSESFILLK